MRGEPFEFVAFSAEHLRGAGGTEIAELRAFEHDVFRLRYSVYIEEHGLQSPYANYEEKTIRDNLDDSAIHLVARTDQKTVGCLRLNLARNSDLGDFVRLYNMAVSPKHPERTCASTKLIVANAYRGYRVDVELLNFGTEISLRYLDIDEHYIDCRIELLPYYLRLGGRKAGAQFTHYETGLACPLVFDLKDHAYLQRSQSVLARNRCVVCVSDRLKDACEDQADCRAYSLSGENTEKKNESL